MYSDIPYELHLSPRIRAIVPRHRRGWIQLSLFPVCLLLILAGTGCGGGSSSGSTGSSTTKTLTTIAVTPATASIAVGATQQFTATGTYSDGSTANVSSTATWTAATATVATVSSTGLATAVAAGSTNMTASLSGVSGSAALTVTPKPVASLAITPSTASTPVGGTEQFTATATYTDGTTANVSTTATWTSATTTVATISATGLATGVAVGTSNISASLNAVIATTPATLTVTTAVPVSTTVNIPTFHVDNNRSGLNAEESSLTTANVNSTSFGKLFSYLVDGYVYGEPLLMSGVTINGGTHNVLYVATEHDSVYAFDADSYGTGAPLWQVSLLNSGETPLTAGAILPYQGVTSTPVIDTTTNTIYVVSAQKNTASGATGFRLSALDITTGAQKFGGPVAVMASVPGTNSDAVNGLVPLTTSCVQRAALLLANGNLYIGFGGCHSGWLLAYDATTLARTGVFNASPNHDGSNLAFGGAGGIWMGGGGPAADSAGNIYVTTGNGPWNAPAGDAANLAANTYSFGDSVLKFNAQLQLQDYFTPDDYQYMDCQDADLAAGGILLIPGSTQALVGGKTSKLYLVNTANMGHEAANDTGAAQTLFFEGDLGGISNPYMSAPCTVGPTGIYPGSYTAEISSYEIFSTAAYFNGSVYLGVTPTAANVLAGVREFPYASLLLTPGAYPANYSAPSIQMGSYGTTPFISADGTSNGIMWMIDHGEPLQTATPTSATLRAYDAANLGGGPLYQSSTNAADVPGYGIKFTSPIVANGKVYISTGHALSTTTNPQGEIDVYGLK